MAGKCNRCGRLGATITGLCPDCLRVDAEKQRNRILENQALQEQKAREEQARLERVRAEQERRYQEEQNRRERERDEQERQYREEQRRLDQERYRQEREDRQRQLEKENQLQEERLRLERERIEAEQRRYEEEKREREWKEEQERLERERQEQERAWAERCNYLDNLPDEEMKSFFETSASRDEREYLKPRYRKSISSSDYLELIKDESKYIARKQIQQYIETHSEKDAIDCLLGVDPRWYAQIVEKEYLEKFIIAKEPLLQEFFDGKWLSIDSENVNNVGDFVVKSCKGLLEKYNAATKPELRQVFLRIIVAFIRFIQMSSVEKQIFFREFIADKMKNVEYSPDGYDTENGVLYSMMEPLYIESLPLDEQKAYLDKMKEAENEYRAKQEEKRIAEERRKAAEEQRLLEIAKKEKECAEIQKMLDEKWQENEEVVAECNAVGRARDKISKQVDGINQFGMKYHSQIVWSLLVVGCYSLIFTRVSAIMVVVPITLFCFSIALFVKQYKVIGTLGILSLLSLLITVAVLNNDEATVWERIAGLLIACSPLIALGIFAVKRIFDVKRLNLEIQQKVVEDGEKQEKQNALAEKNKELIIEIEKHRKKIDRLQVEIDNLKNECQPETNDTKLDPEIEQLMNME